MTGLDHQHTAAISEAARWLAAIPGEKRPRPLVPELKARFGLTAKEAIDAIAEANSGGGDAYP